MITTARPIQAALASARSFTVGALLPLVVAIFLPPNLIVTTIIVSTLIALTVLGIIGAKTGSARVLKPTVRVLFWGALSLGLTTLVGVLFGVKL